jgi:hypothetical protein
VSYKTGYGSDDFLNGEIGELRVRKCPYEYDKDNEKECLGFDTYVPRLFAGFATKDERKDPGPGPWQRHLACHGKKAKP